MQLDPNVGVDLQHEHGGRGHFEVANVEGLLTVDDQLVFIHDGCGDRTADDPLDPMEGDLAGQVVAAGVVASHAAIQVDGGQREPPGVDPPKELTVVPLVARPEVADSQLDVSGRFGIDVEGAVVDPGLDEAVQPYHAELDRAHRRAGNNQDRGSLGNELESPEHARHSGRWGRHITDCTNANSFISVQFASAHTSRWRPNRVWRIRSAISGKLATASSSRRGLRRTKSEDAGALGTPRSELIRLAVACWANGSARSSS